MAGPYSGNDGVIQVGSQSITLVRSWEWTETRNQIPRPAMGDAVDKTLNGRNTVTGRLTCMYDEDDAQQVAIFDAQGSDYLLRLWPDGQGSGKPEWNCSAVRTTAVTGTQEVDSIVEISLEFQSQDVWQFALQV